ncbi:MAG: cupin domain-containing protein [Acidobacteria bacterium]|nr:cupin domain-containing protein [Acidobacteriota bacterium]
MTAKISVDECCSRLDEPWRPRVIAALNGQEVKLIRVKGVFPWHRHDDADEFFLVWKGRFSVEFRDRRVDMSEGDCVLVPRGVEHRTSAAEDAYVLCFEPAGTVNTGNLPANDFTAPGGVSIFDTDDDAK